MATARLRANWDETAALLAHLSNVVGGALGASTSISPADLNPYRGQRKAAAAPIALTRQEAISLFKSIATRK